MKVIASLAAVLIAVAPVAALAQAPGGQGTMGGSANTPTSEGMKSGTKMMGTKKKTKMKKRSSFERPAPVHVIG
ncbi:hypothetical protein [Chelatococcus reniformis]|uniref:Pentapeptide MXKDX repeat protein n=1 Tax=Chelatococcus reniformis TaxID=1494448 RepID=A0A916XGN8_9HYPH|nr:hypothetical protein [Chelatococcus reniformis]GGC70690.1 hypothetical protein GCM10010994_31540 [Chelatococcus reniformis]